MTVFYVSELQTVEKNGYSVTYCRLSAAPVPGDAAMTARIELRAFAEGLNCKVPVHRSWRLLPVTYVLSRSQRELAIARGALPAPS